MGHRFLRRERAGKETGRPQGPPLDTPLLAEGQCPPGTPPGHPIPVHGWDRRLPEDFEQGIRLRPGWGWGIRQDSVRFSWIRSGSVKYGQV